MSVLLEHGGDVEALSGSAKLPLAKVSAILESALDAEGKPGVVDDEPFLDENRVFALAGLEAGEELLEELSHEHVVEPLREALSLDDAFSGLLAHNCLLVLQNVPLDQVPVLEFLSLDSFLFTSLEDLLAFCLIAGSLLTSNFEFVLFALLT